MRKLIVAMLIAEQQAFCRQLREESVTEKQRQEPQD